MVHGWELLAKRLSSLALQTVKPKKPNYRIISFAVVIDHQGNPVGWLKPQTNWLEPGGDWITETPLFSAWDDVQDEG